MNEFDILDYFYDKLRTGGQTKETLFISLDGQVVEELKEKLSSDIHLTHLHKYADICIANEWLERTTADEGYNFLSITEAGLLIAIRNYYAKKI